jgi:hypothetical protein
MNDIEREQKRHDKVINGQFTKRKLTKEEFIQQLQRKGVSTTRNIKNITRLCQLRDIHIEEFFPEMVQEWQRKLKQMLQVLWECGFIDVTNINQYTVGGRKD